MCISEIVDAALSETVGVILGVSEIVGETLLVILSTICCISDIEGVMLDVSLILLEKLLAMMSAIMMMYQSIS